MIVTLKIVTKYSGSFLFRLRDHIGDFSVSKMCLCLSYSVQLDAKVFIQ